MLNFFRKIAIGIDISDHAICIARVEGGKKPRVRAVGRAELEDGVVEKGRIKDKTRLSLAWRRARDAAGMGSDARHKVVFGLPESQVFTHLYELGPEYLLLPESERDAAIQKEVARAIPIHSNDVVYSSRIIFSDKEKTKILIVAASKTVLAEWHAFFLAEGINIFAYDSEILALFRNLRDARIVYPVGVVDIGKDVSNIAIFDAHGICLSYSVPVAGDLLTGEVASALRIKTTEAEKKKKNIGLTDSDSKNLFAIVKALEPLAKEVQSACAQCKRRTGHDVAKIILVGGSSKLPGLKEYLETNLAMPIDIGVSMLSAGGNVSDTDYIEATGLGLRGVDSERYDKDPVLYFGLRKKWYEGLLSITRKKLMYSTLFIIIVAACAVLAVRFLRFSKDDPQIKEQKTVLPEPTPSAAVPTPTPTIEQEPKTLIKVMQTETGWLNVRTGPGTGFPMIAKILPGEEYELIEEGQKWSKIALSDGKDGWISNAYFKKVE